MKKQQVFLNPKSIDVFDMRFYWMGKNKRNQDIWYDSVTHIIDVGFAKGETFSQWLRETGMDGTVKASRAAESGHVVHWGVDELSAGHELAYEMFVDGEFDYRKNKFQIDEWMALEKFRDFYDTYHPEILEHEIIVYNPRHRYAGRLDNISIINGQKWLLDVKFTNMIHPNSFVQLAAYAKCLPDIERIGILHLKARTRGADKSGKNIQGVGWKLVEAPYTMDYHYRIFLSAKRIFDYKKKVGEVPSAPKVFSLPKTIKLDLDGTKKEKEGNLPQSNSRKNKAKPKGTTRGK